MRSGCSLVSPCMLRDRALPKRKSTKLRSRMSPTLCDQAHAVSAYAVPGQDHVLPARDAGSHRPETWVAPTRNMGRTDPKHGSPDLRRGMASVSCYVPEVDGVVPEVSGACSGADFRVVRPNQERNPMIHGAARVGSMRRASSTASTNGWRGRTLVVGWIAGRGRSVGKTDYFGWGTTRKYGLIVFHPPGNRCFASSSDTDGTMITSSPFFQFTGVATLCSAVS